MATLASLVEWITQADVAVAGSEVRAQNGDEFQVRPLPNEDIYFWVRSIDNSRVMAQADPATTKACWKSIAACMLAVLLLVGVLLPAAYNLLAGYQFNALQVEKQKLLDDQALLDMQEAELLSPARLAELAQMQEFVDPAPEHMTPLAPAVDGALAMNR